jgi:RNA processing factor Prp31
MNSFFESDIIQEEIKEINSLQQEIYSDIFNFLSMTVEEKQNHIDKLSDLLEKQKIMYTRLSLSDDPRALELKDNLKKSISFMGFPPETDMNLVFNTIQKTINALKERMQ